MQLLSDGGEGASQTRKLGSVANAILGSTGRWAVVALEAMGRLWRWMVGTGQGGASPIRKRPSPIRESASPNERSPMRRERLPSFRGGMGARP